MLQPLIAGNWKMNTTIEQAADLVLKTRGLLRAGSPAEVVIAPPFTSIHHIKLLLADSEIRLAGQDLFWEKSGAYTGEVSAEMLVDAGCRYVIIGHSERRQIFHETDETVNNKVRAALRAGLKPIICVGETLEEKDGGRTIARIKGQVKGALKGLSGSVMKEMTIAYEPVWAIGTGRTAEPNEAEDVHSSIREFLYELYDTESVNRVRIIYGGSVKADNIDSLMAEPNIDGALVGGASLKAEEFARIINFRHA